ncbi:MFS transporter [Amycolatopsis nigrescens]|uniref:MFS transporter n=1 Tax=Amycolatopsis nigrescens TaxID=381445 RepID=UPI00037411C1|nr:MFS transporter [Amycolatopsis nigrescens]
MSGTESTVDSTDGTRRSSAYREFFAVPGTRWLFLLGLLGRTPSGMLVLLIVLVLQDTTGGYTVAGQVSGALAAGLGLLTPFRARLVDRRGARPVLVSTGLCHSAALVLLWPLAELGAPVPLLLLTGLAIGAFLPPTGVVMRSAWSRLLPDERRRRAAFAAESLAVQSTLLAGPLLVSVLVVTAGPGVGLVCCAGLTLISSLALGMSDRMTEVMRPEPRTGPVDWAGALRARAVWLSLPGGFALFAAITALEITAAGQAVENSVAWAAGWLIAGFAVGGLCGGVVWGWRVWPGRLPWQLAAMHGFMAVVLAVLIFELPLPLVAVLLFVAGVMAPPAMTAQFSVLDAVVPRAVLTESFGWLSSARQAGSAVAAAMTGMAIDAFGSRGGWTVALLAAVIATVASVSLCRVGEPHRGLESR